MKRIKSLTVGQKQLHVCLCSLLQLKTTEETGESVLDLLFQSQTCRFSASRLVQQIFLLVCFGPTCCRSQLRSSGTKLSRKRQKPLTVCLFMSFSGCVQGKSSAQGQISGDLIRDSPNMWDTDSVVYRTPETLLLGFPQNCLQETL